MEDIERTVLADKLACMALKRDLEAATVGGDEEVSLLGQAWGLKAAACMVRDNHPKEDS